MELRHMERMAIQLSPQPVAIRATGITAHLIHRPGRSGAPAPGSRFASRSSRPKA